MQLDGLKVLEEIYATGWTPKYKDRYRTEGVKPIVKYFDENGLLYYDEKALHAFVVQTYQNYLSGKINKSRWQSIRKCSAFMLQMVTDGHISTEPLCRWTTESIALFDEPAIDQMGDACLSYPSGSVESGFVTENKEQLYL